MATYSYLNLSLWNIILLNILNPEHLSEITHPMYKIIFNIKYFPPNDTAPQQTHTILDLEADLHDKAE